MWDFFSQLLAAPGSDGDFLARLSSALILIFIGFVVAFGSRRLLARLKQGLLSLLVERFPSASVRASPISHTTVQFLPRIVSWSILLVFLALSTEMLGFPFLLPSWPNFWSISRG